jgi:3-deoxy-D-manno-octulosonic-acid transferase
VIVDEVGPLAFLYGQGAIAYVGGGFRRAGLHSVLEPAAWGVPVLAGPGGGGNREARMLEMRGGLVVLRHPGSCAQLAHQWTAWLDDSAARERAGDAAREAVAAGSGAAERAVHMVERLVETQRGPALSRPP